ncbi:MAG TPA: hypothetical protein VG603_02360 [Chitinophagales bacterium]|nr:hypothetical protein [Chitinophagales bacterium]
MPVVRNEKGSEIEVSNLIANNEQLLKKYGYTLVHQPPVPQVQKPLTELPQEPKKKEKVVADSSPEIVEANGSDNERLINFIKASKTNENSWADVKAMVKEEFNLDLHWKTIEKYYKA